MKKQADMVTFSVFDEVATFMTSMPKPEAVLHFKPSQTAQLRLEELLDKKREEGLSDREAHELEQFLMVEHLMRLEIGRASCRERVCYPV